MNIFKDILKDPDHLIERAEALEAPVNFLSDNPTSPMLGSTDNKVWYRARRIASHLIWDAYAASAIAHHRALGNTHRPLLDDKGFVYGELPSTLANALEEAFHKCETVPWKDVRPIGYSYSPFIDQAQIDDYKRMTIHKVMSSDMRSVLTETFTTLSPMIERSLGHYWATGAVRVYAAKPQVTGNFHSDGFPLAVKKIMLYPSGAGVEQGSTEIILSNGEHHIVTGGKGVWCLFENTLREHRALGSTSPQPRPTIEVSVFPAFRNDPTIRHHGILVGYPWLPPDIDDLNGDSCPSEFTTQKIKQRMLTELLSLSATLSDKIKT